MHQSKHTEELPGIAVDLDRTDALPILDVASYEQQQLASDRINAVPTEPAESARAREETRLPALPLQSPTDTLRDIEAWITAQEQRALSHERALAETQEARVAAQARADNLALELEVAKQALQTALGRANDGERTALEQVAATRLAESRGATLQSELDEARRALQDTTSRAGELTTELTRLRESLSARTREHEEAQQRHAELTRTLEERGSRMAGLEGERATLRTQLTEAKRELSERTERLAASHAAHETLQKHVDSVMRERDAIAARVASVAESARSRVFRRNFWEGMWVEVDSELASTRASAARIESERAGLAAALARLKADLAERETVIERLKAEGAGQLKALEELNATRAREQQDHSASAAEARLSQEKLAGEINTLGDAQKRAAEVLATSEAELAESRARRRALEETLRTAQAAAVAQLARIAELEALVANLGGGLRTQTEAVQRATESIAERERELAQQRTRIGALETELHTTSEQLREHAALGQSAELALSEHITELNGTRERLAAAESHAKQQAAQLAGLSAELAAAETRRGETEAARSTLQKELADARIELQKECERANALDARQRDLALELERTRGALGERELQLRRLERYATSSAQVLSRIKVGIERGDSAATAATTGSLKAPEVSGTLVPLDDSDAPALPLGRQSTVGRAVESDVCLRDSSVSRRHAVLTIGPGGAFVEDLRSVNGVILNRQRIRHARLTDGDVIEFGLKRFRFTAAPQRGTGVSH